MEALRAAMGSSVKVPGVTTSVMKSECLYSFDTPLSLHGIYTSLLTFRSVGEDFLGLYTEKTGSRVYLHQKMTRTRKVKTGDEGEKDAMVASTSGGVKLTAKDDVYDEKMSYSIFLMPERISFPFPDPQLPELIIMSADMVIASVEVTNVSHEAADWAEKRYPSKYAKDLPQIDNGKKIGPDPKSWRCEDSNTTDNLWLNLSDGYIGSGRKNWDGTGGTGAALKHYEETGCKYPLCVKLGTITAQGADVFSYASDENDMVEDPYLAQHLEHWGINMKAMEKTEKTMAEMEVELNKSYEFSRILEGGENLKEVTGAGYIGLENLGNSCYMNSVLQVMFTVPEMKARYVDEAMKLFQSAPVAAEEDLLTQLAKVGTGLLTDRYRNESVENKVRSKEEEEKELTQIERIKAIFSSVTQATQAMLMKMTPDLLSELEGLVVIPRPRMFKNLVGKNHKEFSTGHQQDASEYYQFLLDKIERAERVSIDRLLELKTGTDPMENLFRFRMEERLEDVQSGQVKYDMRTENSLHVRIPVTAATNKAVVEEYEEREKKRAKLKEDGLIMEGIESLKEEEEPVKLSVPFSACLESLFLPKTISGFTSPVTKEKGTALLTDRFKTFPKYLVFEMLRFYHAEDWTPKKLDVLVDVPEFLDLEKFRATGIKEGEVLMEETLNGPGEETVVNGSAVADAGIVNQLVATGFSENAAKRAALATHNSDAQTSMNWLLEHLDDPDLNDPVDTGVKGGNGVSAMTNSSVDGEKVGMLQGMGFALEHAEAALEATKGDVEAAGEWLITRIDDIDAAVAEVKAKKLADTQVEDRKDELPLNDGPGKYELLGFISHIGNHTATGHYVAHVKKDGKWVLFNDEKVAWSSKPPKDLGYLYMFHRVD